MVMVWVCEKCNTMNAHEVSTYNRIQPRQVATCRKCGAPHPEGFYTTD